MNGTSSCPAAEPLPVPLRLLADFPPAFLDHVRSGDWPLYAMPFESNTHAVACWAEIKNGDVPMFFVDDSLIEGSAVVRAALRVLVDRVLDTEAERVQYMRMPAAVAAEDMATAQRAEWHVDVSDDELAELAARAEYTTWEAFACPDCGHLPGCGCECCPYAMPALAAAEQLVGGVR